MRYTAERLMEAGATITHGTKSMAFRIRDQLDGEELIRFGSAWQREVMVLREQIATLLAERAQK